MIYVIRNEIYTDGDADENIVLEYAQTEKAAIEYLLKQGFVAKPGLNRPYYLLKEEDTQTIATITTAKTVEEEG